MAENFPNLKKEINIQVQEAQRNPERPTLWHIIIKMTKAKINRLLRAAREEQRVMYKGIPIKPSADFSAETLQARESDIIWLKCTLLRMWLGGVI